MGWGELKPNKEATAEKYRWVKRASGNLISPFHLGLLIKIVHAFQKGGILFIQDEFSMNQSRHGQALS